MVESIGENTIAKMKFFFQKKDSMPFIFPSIFIKAFLYFCNFIKMDY